MNIEQEYPIKIELKEQGGKKFEICYMKFGEYWFAIGLGKEIAKWQWEKLKKN